MKHLTSTGVLLCISTCASAATMYSRHDSYMGAGTFYGPGRLSDSVLFDAQIQNISFPSTNTFITPLFNNGGEAPNLCGETETGRTPTGFLSDGKTRLNENVDVCAFNVNNMKILAGVIDGGLHGGQQIAVALEGGVMIMTMDFALDLGVGEAGILKLYFYGTTDEVTVPYSLQTQMKLPGGVDQAGSMKSGTKLRGRLGDFNHDGMLDGAIVVAGNMPLNSIFMPGAPYALIRYFDTDVPYAGSIIGKLPRERAAQTDAPTFTLIDETVAAPAAQISPHSGD